MSNQQVGIIYFPSHFLNHFQYRIIALIKKNYQKPQTIFDINDSNHKSIVLYILRVYEK